MPNHSEFYMPAKTRLVIIAVVLVFALGYFVYSSFPGNAMYYLTIDELTSGVELGTISEDQTVRVVGNLVEDSFVREEDSLQAYFLLTNDEDNVIYAIYSGPVPDTFFSPHTQIVLEGRYSSDGIFSTDDLTVKCPSKYQSAEEENDV